MSVKYINMFIIWTLIMNLILLNKMAIILKNIECYEIKIDNKTLIFVL
jgi:hypothetical protein